MRDTQICKANRLGERLVGGFERLDGYDGLDAFLEASPAPFDRRFLLRVQLADLHGVPVLGRFPSKPAREPGLPDAVLLTDEGDDRCAGFRIAHIAAIS